MLAASDLRVNDSIGIEFADGRVGARVTEAKAAAPRPAVARHATAEGGGGQGSLL